MTLSLACFMDPGLTVPASVIDIIAANDGSSGDIDRMFYLASLAPGKRFVAAADPGVAPILFGVVDSAPGEGVEAAHVRLATSVAGLDDATPGQPLNLGTELLSGAGNAVAIHLRFNAGALADGTYNDLAMVTSALLEVDA